MSRPTSTIRCDGRPYAFSARASAARRLVLLGAVAALVLLVVPPTRAEPGTSTASTTTPREPRLEDFAEAIVLTPREARAVHTALLPIEVHRGVTRSDLGDLRVFDASGRLVPHALRTLDAPEDPEASAVALRFFPIEAPKTASSDLEALTLHVVRDGRGTVVDVRAGSHVDGAAAAGGTAAAPIPGAGAAATSAPATGRAGASSVDPARIVAYVLDTGALERPLTALRVELAPSEGDYMLPVSVETSDDLTRFARVGPPRSLVRLTWAGEQIAQDRFELPAVEARYVVLRWKAGSLPAPLVRVTGELQGERTSAELVVHRIEGRPHADDAERVDFDLGGLVPVDRVRVVLGEENALVAAELLAGADAAGPLASVGQTTVYRVATGGQTLESPALAPGRRIDRYWAVRAQSKGGGWGTALPALEIAYYPQQLIFLARGEAPFTLAYGRHDAAPSTFAWEELVGFLPEAERASLPRSDVEASAPRVVAGESARIPPPPPLPIRRYVLWAVLVLGVAGLGLAAWRMVRDVREPG